MRSKREGRARRGRSPEGEGSLLNARLQFGVRVGLAVAVLLGLLTGLHWLHGLDNWLAAGAFAVRGPLAPEPSVVIVSLDAASEATLKPLPWPVETWQQGLKQVLSAGPRAVALDLADVRKAVDCSGPGARLLAATIAGRPAVLAFARL